MLRLSNDRGQAMAEAEAINKQVDEWRGDPAKVTLPSLRVRRVIPVKRLGIYVVGTAKGRVKIGVSRDPVKRLQALQVANDRDLRLYFYLYCDDIPARTIERAVHECLWKTHLSGEWFEISPHQAIVAIMFTVSKLRRAAAG